MYALHIDKRTARTAEKVSSISKDYLVIFCVTSDAKSKKKADDFKSSANGVNASFTFYAASKSAKAALASKSERNSALVDKLKSSKTLFIRLINLFFCSSLKSSIRTTT